jgi:hypothetical protein
MVWFKTFVDLLVTLFVMILFLTEDELLEVCGHVPIGGLIPLILALQDEIERLLHRTLICGLHSYSLLSAGLFLRSIIHEWIINLGHRHLKTHRIFTFFALPPIHRLDCIDALGLGW